MRIGMILAVGVSVASPAIAPAAPPPVVAVPATPDRVAAPVTPARTVLAHELVGYTQPKDLMLAAVLNGWEIGEAENDNDLARFEEIEPGLGKRIVERSKAELMGLVAERIPQMHDRLATLFAENCTEEELKSLIAFYGSPAGKKLVRSITLSNKGGDAFDDEHFTAEEATRANRDAAKDAVKTLDGDEWMAAAKFGLSPAGRLVKALSPQVQAISAEWMTALMADYGKRIEPAVEEMVRQAIDKADKRPGGN